ncbi:MAG: ABC transporter ATP-binding protein [Candidatus Symbiothrix sp.]|jgi:ABC-2 type transport system ATP-binding protein|nr:ABC transporter ATP-binding protein [Candidatus Symbiothrix sp.]
MNLFEIQYRKSQKLLEYENYDALLKCIIDHTLDTEDLTFYRKTVDLLDRLDNKANAPKRREKLTAILGELYDCLSKKEIKERQKLLEVRNLVKEYPHSCFSLGPIDLELWEGEIVGLAGENGNGKTTLLRSLCLELEPTDGQIRYFFPYKDQYDLRTQLVYIPQRTDNWQGSLLDNLQFTASSYGIFGEENECLVQLIIARMGLREYRSLNWSGLSSGYKMRFELARMLLRKPKLLLIDEPLANLDILAQQTVLDDFKGIAQSPFRPLGIVLSSQQLYEVEKTSDKVIFLKNGKPKNTTDASENPEEEKLIIEFECACSQDRLQSILSTLGLEKIQQSGGTYIACFQGNTTQEDFLKIIAENQLPLSYFRNISHSTRRFFL